jgi:outer membrane protein assembly factor BamB
MVALSLDTGAQLWSRPLELTTTGFLADSNPIYFDHFVYYSRGPQGIVAVNSASGEVAWTRSLPFEIFATEGRPIAESPPEDRPDAIAVDASGVYVVWANTGVQALDRETGTELWTRTMSAYSTRGVGTSSVSVTNDLVLVGVHRPEVSGEASTSMITAFGKTEGLTIWQKVTDDFVGNLAIAGTALVIPLANGTIDTYDTSDGTLLKSYTLGWDGTAPIGISSNDESFIATYWQDGAVTVEIVPPKVFAQSGTWKFTSDSATSWEYIPEAHIVGNALVFPTLEDSLWMIEPTGQGR